MHGTTVLNAAACLVMAGGALATPQVITFASPVHYALPVSAPVQGAAAGDFDRDGDFDIVIVVSGVPGSIIIMTNHGDGTFASANFVPVGSSSSGVAVGDLDGDGWLDLAVANSSSDFNRVSVILNLGADGGSAWRGFAAPVDYPSGLGQMGQNGIALADLDGNGSLDVATANRQANSVSILPNNGGAILGPALVMATGPKPEGIAAADLNGDGDPDLATANVTGDSGPGSTSIVLDAGQFSFAPPVNYPTASNPGQVITLDADGDGDLDLAFATTTSYEITVLSNRGSGQFELAPSPHTQTHPESIAATDVDGDGDVDLALGGHGISPAAGMIEIFRNNGSGVFTAGATVDYNRDPMAVVATAINMRGQIVPLDLNADGRADLVAANTNPYSATVLMNQTQMFALGDINRSGHVDGVDLAILLGMWGPVTAFPQADLNHDGIVNGLDLAILLGHWG